MNQDEYVRTKALEHARALGCDCEPEIDFKTGGKVGGKVMHLTIAHDDTCALMSDSKE